MKQSLVLFIWGFLISLLPLAVLAESSITCQADIEGKSDAELHQILARCEAEIAEQKKNLEATRQQSAGLKQGIAELNQKIKKVNLEIKARNIKIKQLNVEISDRAGRIGQLNQRMENIRESLSLLLRKTNEFSDFTAVEFLLSGEGLSGFFQDIDDFAAIKAKLGETLGAIREVKAATEEEKRRFEETKQKEQAFKLAQEEDKRKTENYRSEKERILEVTRGREEEYRKIIVEKERIKNEIRNRIFRTVGGQEMTFGEALKLVLPYQNPIGVEAALVLAVLSQESAIDGVIGRNLGKCFYNQPAANPASTVMANSQKPSFLAITSELGLNPDTIPVSCPIYSDGAYGGAMGPAQFMPKTWWDVEDNDGYKLRVSALLGDPIPSPFENLDAFVGTAIYLSDAARLCRTSFSSTFELWNCSAAKYYSGLQARGSRLARHMRPGNYGHQVASRASQFQKDIDLLDL